MYIGAPCEFTCHAKLHHVFCDPSTNFCVCEKSYPVVIGLTKGCSKREYNRDMCLDIMDREKEEEKVIYYFRFL